MGLSDIIRKSSKLAYGEFSTIPGADISQDCDIIRSILLDAGWSQAGDVKATASMSFPLGFPTTRGSGGGLDATNRIGAFYGHTGLPGVIIFQFWDDTVGETDPSIYDPIRQITIQGVKVGTSGDETATRLAASMSAGLWITGIIEGLIGAIGITFESSLAGTGGNNYTFNGTGAFSTGSGISEGGGWIMQSRTQQEADVAAGTSPPSTNKTRTTLIVRSGAPAQHGLQINAHVDGISALDFYAAQGSKWMLWANPFVALFESDAPFHAGDVFVFNSALWCGSISLPSELNLNPVGFLWNNSGIFSTIGTGSAFAQASTVAGGNVHVGGFSETESSFAFYHSQSNGGGIPLLTRMNKSLLVPALVMMRTTPPEAPLPDEARIVGYMWDCFIETRYHPNGTLIMQDGEPYRAVSSQNGNVVGTLWLRWPVKAPDPGTTQPPPEPQFVGTANVFGYGVTRISGDAFTPDIVGRALYINGVPYKVAKFLDADNINLEAVAGIQPGAAYHT